MSSVTITGAVSNVEDLPRNPLAGAAYVVDHVGIFIYDGIQWVESGDQRDPTWSLTYRGIEVRIEMPHHVADLIFDKDNIHKEDLSLLDMLHKEYLEEFKNSWSRGWIKKQADDEFDKWRDFL